MDNQDIQLKLTADEINLILEGLGNMQFVKVYSLISKIQQQAAGQLNKASETSVSTPEAAK